MFTEAVTVAEGHRVATLAASPQERIELWSTGPTRYHVVAFVRQNDAAGLSAWSISHRVATHDEQAAVVIGRALAAHRPVVRPLLRLVA